MDQILILNDGTRLFPAHAIEDGYVLWVYLDGGVKLNEAFELLSVPEKTEKIKANNYGSLTEYTGFTDLFCIRREDNGQVNAGLKKAVG